MFIKPDYNLKNIYEIDLDDLKNQGINALLFDLDSTIMGSKTGCGKKLGCKKTILVDSITANIEKPIVRFARKLERVFIKK